MFSSTLKVENTKTLFFAGLFVVLFTADGPTRRFKTQDSRHKTRDKRQRTEDRRQEIGGIKSGFRLFECKF